MAPLKSVWRACACAWCLLLCAIAPAQAAAIMNLSGVPQSFTVVEGNQHREILVPAGKKFRTLGRATFLRNGRMVRIDDNEEYAIWPDGTFGPQRRYNRRSSPLRF